jgi:hypothetical protein
VSELETPIPDAPITTADDTESIIVEVLESEPIIPPASELIDKTLPSERSKLLGAW